MPKPPRLLLLPDPGFREGCSGRHRNLSLPSLTFSCRWQCYEVLINVCPDVEDYRLYLSQAYYKAGMYTEALRSSMRVTSERNHHKGKLLQGLIKYSQDDDAGSTSIFGSLSLPSSLFLSFDDSLH